MKINNPFDRHLDACKGEIPKRVLDGAVYTNDTLNLAWLSAQSIFEDKATPEVALAIYDRMQQVIKSKK